MGKMREIVVYDFDEISLSQAFYAALEPHFETVTVLTARCDFAGRLAELDLARTDAFVSRVFDDFSCLADRAPSLKYVGSCHTDLSHYPLEALRKRGVAVTNVPKYASNSVAELTVGMLVSLARHIPAATQHVAEGGWDVQRFVGQELRGKIVGMVGLGAIGREVAKVCQALGMQVMSCTRSTSVEGMPTCSLQEIFSQSDVVVVVASLNDSSRGMIRAELLRLLKDRAILLVPARHEIFSIKDLFDACRAGRIAVWLDEVQESQLRAELKSFPNVFLTPDYGWLTREALDRQEQAALANLQRWLSA